MKFAFLAHVRIRHGASGQLTGRKAEGKDGVIADRPGAERQADERYFVRIIDKTFGPWFDWFDGDDLVPR